MEIEELDSSAQQIINDLIFDLQNEKDIIATISGKNKLRKMFAKNLMKVIKEFVEHKFLWSQYDTVPRIMGYIFYYTGEYAGIYAKRYKVNVDEIIKAVKDYDLWDEAFTLLGFGDDNKEAIDEAYASFTHGLYSYINY